MLRLFALAGLAMTVLGARRAAQRRRRTPRSTPSPTSRSDRCWPRSAPAALHAYRDAARKDAVSLDVFQRIDRPNQFVVLGAWADQKAFETPFGRRHRQEAERKARDHAGRADRHPPAQRPVGRAGQDRQGCRSFVVTHVDVIPPEKDNGANALEQLADGSRRHAGNLQFDVWRQTNRPNHFTVVEAWANRGAFDVHEMQKETREFRMKLGPMSGALYDERLYKVLP